MNNFYLVRHGVKVKAFGDPGLSAVGVKQAKMTGKYFKNMKISSIFSSPLKRTLETARCISEIININVKIDERLRERMNWGDKKDQTFEEFMSEWDKTTIDRHYQPSVGDSSFNAGERINSLIEELSETERNDVVLVSHGGVVADLLRNLFSHDYVKKFYPDFLEIDLSECSVSHLVENNGEYKLKMCNFVDHLS